MKSDDEYQLEQVFSHAVHEPAYRPAFLEQLLAANIYCICYSTDPLTQDMTGNLFNGDQNISLKTWEDPEYGHIIPFFTSLEKLGKVALEQDKFVCLPCRVLFEMTLGAYLVLNLESDAIKEFFPDEVRDLLMGDFGQILESYEIEADTELLINQPDEYPQFMVEQLRQFFLSELHIIAAYLAQIYDVEIDEKPSLIIGLRLDKYLSEYYVDELHRKIAQVAYASLEHKQTINLVHIDLKEDGINRYFRDEVQPFYIRPKENKHGFFAKLFS